MEQPGGNNFAVGFIGIGAMGEAMALNLLKRGTRLVAWNRTADKTKSVAEAGALIAHDAEEVFASSDVVILMLADGQAIDAVLSRGTTDFLERVKKRTIIHMGTTSAEYSKGLQVHIHSAGGNYVEAPVSGSRKPAENGQLVAMLAGREDIIDKVSPLMMQMCRQTVFCGPVPNALLMKLSTNLLLISMITGLAEAVHFASRYNLDLDKFSEVLMSGPMANDVLRVKIPKLLTRDFSVQAAIDNVLDNARLVVDAAEREGIVAPLAHCCKSMYETAASLGLGAQDMIAVIKAIEARESQ